MVQANYAEVTSDYPAALAAAQTAVEQAKKAMAERSKHRKIVKDRKFDTIAVHGMYCLEEALATAQGSVVEPLFPSTYQPFR